MVYLFNSLFNGISDVANGLFECAGDTVNYVSSNPWAMVFLSIGILFMLFGTIRNLFCDAPYETSSPENTEVVSSYEDSRDMVEWTNPKFSKEPDIKVRVKPKTTWHCTYCDGTNSIKDRCCPGCGAVKH